MNHGRYNHLDSLAICHRSSSSDNSSWLKEGLLKTTLQIGPRNVPNAHDVLVNAEKNVANTALPSAFFMQIHVIFRAVRETGSVYGSAVVRRVCGLFKVTVYLFVGFISLDLFAYLF